MSEDAIYTEREQNDDITLQFGFHGSPKEMIDRYALFDQGNLDVCGWPDEGIRSRLIEEQPQALAVDGISPDSESFIHRRYYEWVKLPLRPDLLNSEGKVNVIGGDIASLLFALDLANVSYDVIESTEEKYMNTLNSDLVKLQDNADIPLTSGIGYAATTIGAMMEGEKKNDTSRRAFLRRTGKGINAVGKAAVGVGIGGIITRFGALYSNRLIKDQKVYNPFLSIAEKLGPKIAGTTWWVNGRTALLIAKSKDADLGKTAVVMGGAHMFNSLELLHNKDARLEAIRTMRDNMHILIKDLQRDIPEIKDLDLVERFDNYLPRYDVLTFVDPGDKPVKPQDLEKEGYITRVGSFVSKEVQEAIR